MTYVYTLPGTYDVSVGVTDARPITVSAPTTINAARPAARGEGGVAAPPLEVPLGGELVLVWGDGGTITAQSADETIVGVGVSESVIRVAGVSVGNTEVIVRTGSVEYRLPVAVGK